MSVVAMPGDSIRGMGRKQAKALIPSESLYPEGGLEMDPIARAASKFLFGCVLLAPAILTGCFTADHRSVYPLDWPQAKAIPAETCPDIAGRYLNAGVGSSGWDSNMKYFCTGYPQGRGPRPSWICDTSLWRDLVDASSVRSVRVIEIRQPDSATLLISIPDDPSIQPQTLSLRHGDFKCDASGLTMSRVGSDMDAVNTVVSVLVLHFGVASSSRSFRPLGNGSLLMDVTNEHFVTQEILATGTIKGQGFVRWDRDTSYNATEKATSKEREAQ